VRKLTERQRRFVLAFVACGNATQAAREAGYGKPNPEGARQLAKARVAAAIAEASQARKDAAIADATERQRFWTRIMRGEDGAASMADRLRASELLGRACGDFLERLEVSGRLDLMGAVVRATEVREARQRANRV
jgi:phage terminase small subunit